MTEPKYRDDGFIPSVENPGQPMTNEEYQDIATKQLHEVARPQYSNWRVHLMNGVVFTPKFGCEPNRFHRRMQELAFGVKWERLGND